MKKNNKKSARTALTVSLLFALSWTPIPSTSQTTTTILKDIYLMGFMPMTGKVWPGGRALVPALDMALRHVNARGDVLPGYNLKVIWRDTQCNAGISNNAMFELLYNPPVKHMILGPLCSTEAEVQAESAHYWNISHFSFGSASPVLSNRKRFPRFFRVQVPEQRYNLARVALCEHFNWKKIATISSALPLFSAVTDDFVTLLQTTDITIITQEIFENDPTLRVHNLKNKDARIIISGSYEHHGKLILCAAYRVGLYGPKIVWIFPGWYIPYWWRFGLDNVPCTADEMDVAAEGHILTGIYFRNPKDERSIGGITPTEFDELRTREPTYTNETRMFEHPAANVYDSVWACALALNCTNNVLIEQGHAKSLGEFSYSDGDIGDVMTSCIYNLSFTGLTGGVSFDQTGEPLKNIKIDQIQGVYNDVSFVGLTGGVLFDQTEEPLKNIKIDQIQDIYSLSFTGVSFDQTVEPLKNIKIDQNQDLEKTNVGTYVMDEGDARFLEWNNGGIRWPDGVPPRDSTQITMVEQTLPVSLYTSMSGGASLGIVLAVALLVFNITHRNHVYVKLSSPNINNVLVTGCILSYSSVYMFAVSDGTSALLCKLRHFVFTIGFTTAFGAMFSKTWRVYKIFCNKKLLRVKINDLQLFVIVLVMVAIMLLILVVWQLIDPLIVQTVILENETYESGNDALVIPFLRDCTSAYYYYFLCTICILEGVMLAFGAFLSFETRKIRIEALNDARQIGMCLYNVIILSVLVLILSVLLNNHLALVYGIFSGFVVIGTTATLLIIFIPKIQSVFWPHTVEPHPGTMGTNGGSSFGVPKSIISRTASTQQSLTLDSVGNY